jgi:small nuclear ribonucleoprotein (snRNP)-like protein
MKNLLILLILLLIPLTGCTVMGHAIGESIDRNNAKNSVLVLNDLEHDEIIRNLESLLYREISIITKNDRTLQAILTDYSIDNYIDVSITNHALFSPSTPKRIIWSDISYISCEQNKPISGRIIGAFTGFLTDAAIMVILIMNSGIGGAVAG